jgi:hypothetical protein
MKITPSSRGVIAGLFLMACLAVQGYAVDLAKIDRTIKAVPTFKTKSPKYCLVVFGPDAKHPVWLILDGDVLHVDRNGNRDLSEAGETTTLESRNSDPANFKPVTIAPSGAQEEQLEVALFGWFDYRDGKESERFMPALSVSWKGRAFGAWGDETGPPVWGARPQDAPILHVAGPLQMGFESRVEYVLRRKGEDEFELAVGVGTKGLGKGTFTHLGYANDGIPKNVFPSAVLEFPNKTPGGPPVVVRTKLKERC